MSFRLAIGAAIVAVAIGVGAYVLTAGDDAAPPSTASANVWVDTSGGTCTRQATPAAYDDAAACASLAAAWDAAQAGDRIRVRPGTYTAAQTITGGKASETTITGEGGVTITAPVIPASHLTLENVAIDGGETGQFDAFTINGARDVTLRDVKVHGYYARVVLSGANGFKWLGGEQGTPGWTPRKRQCTRPPDSPDAGDGNPVEIDGGTNIVIDGVYFARQDHGDMGTDGCPPNDDFHLEIIRLQDAVHGFTLRNSFFEPGNRANTAVILNTYLGGISTDIAVLNNFFGGTEGVGAFQVGGPGGTSDCANQLIAYNTVRAGLRGLAVHDVRQRALRRQPRLAPGLRGLHRRLRRERLAGHRLAAVRGHRHVDPGRALPARRPRSRQEPGADGRQPGGRRRRDAGPRRRLHRARGRDRRRRRPRRPGPPRPPASGGDACDAGSVEYQGDCRPAGARRRGRGCGGCRRSSSSRCTGCACPRG